MTAGGALRLRLLRHCGGIDGLAKDPAVASNLLRKGLERNKPVVEPLPNSPFAKKVATNSEATPGVVPASAPTAPSLLPLERVTLLDFAGRHEEAEKELRESGTLGNPTTDGNQRTEEEESALFAREVVVRHRKFAEVRQARTEQQGGTVNHVSVPKDVSYEEAMTIRDRPFVMRARSVPEFLTSFANLEAFFALDPTLKLPTRSRVTREKASASSSSSSPSPDELHPVPAFLFPEINVVPEMANTTRQPQKTMHRDEILWAHLKDDSARVTFKEFLKQSSVSNSNHDHSSNPNSQSLIFDFSVWRTPLGRKFAERVHDFPPLPHVDYLAPAQIRGAPVEGSSFPTLFVNTRPGAGAGAHVDFSGTHFWQLVGSGKKRYQLVSRDELAFLHPKYLDELSSPWIADGPESGAMEAASAKYGVPIHEVDVESGDVIFVPAGWAHRVSNLEPTIALSGNFVDKSNLADVLEQLKTEAACGCEGAKVLYEELRTLDYAEIDRGCLEEGGMSIGTIEKPAWDLASSAISKEARVKSMTLAEVKAVGGEGWTPEEKRKLVVKIEKGKVICAYFAAFGVVGVAALVMERTQAVDEE